LILPLAASWLHIAIIIVISYWYRYYWLIRYKADIDTFLSSFAIITIFGWGCCQSFSMPLSYADIDTYYFRWYWLSFGYYWVFHAITLLANIATHYYCTLCHDTLIAGWLFITLDIVLPLVTLYWPFSLLITPLPRHYRHCFISPHTHFRRHYADTQPADIAIRHCADAAWWLAARRPLILPPPLRPHYASAVLLELRHITLSPRCHIRLYTLPLLSPLPYYWLILRQSGYWYYYLEGHWCFITIAITPRYQYWLRYWFHTILRFSLPLHYADTHIALRHFSPPRLPHYVILISWCRYWYFITFDIGQPFFSSDAINTFTSADGHYYYWY